MHLIPPRLRTLGTSPTAVPGQLCKTSVCLSPGSTYRVQEHSQEQFTPIDDFVQLTGATRVFIVENGVREEATGLPGKYLGQEKRYGWNRQRSQGNEMATWSPRLPELGLLPFPTKRGNLTSTLQRSGPVTLLLIALDLNTDTEGKDVNRWKSQKLSSRKLHPRRMSKGEQPPQTGTVQKPPAEVLVLVGGAGEEKHKRQTRHPP